METVAVHADAMACFLFANVVIGIIHSSRNHLYQLLPKSEVIITKKHDMIYKDLNTQYVFLGT